MGASRYRFMVQIREPQDGSLWLMPLPRLRGLAAMGSSAQHFPDAATAEVAAEKFRRANPGYGTKVVEDLGIPATTGGAR